MAERLGRFLEFTATWTAWGLFVIAWGKSAVMKDVGAADPRTFLLVACFLMLAAIRHRLPAAPSQEDPTNG